MSDPLQDFLQSLPPDKLAAILGSGTLDQNDAMLQQQMEAAKSHRQQAAGQRAYGAQAGMAAGLGSLLGGVQEAMLQKKQQGNIDQRQQALNAFAQQAQGGNMRGAGILGILTGNKQLGGVGESLVGEANRQEQIARTQPGIDLANKEKAQEIEQAGPQAALGGKTPKIYELITKRDQVPKFSVNPLTGETYDTRTGKGSGKGGGGGASSLTPQALDQLAELFHQTGQLPPVGRGASAAVTIKAIVNRSAELHPDASLAGNKAGYKADTGSLGKMQTQADSIESFENTALKNLDNFIKTASGVIDVGSPLFNKPLRSLDASVMGDVNTAKFNTARQVAVQEIGKVLGGAVQGGAISDSQRHEVEGLLSGDMSLAQIKAAADVLKQDMANRKGAVREQIENVRARVSGKPTAPAPAPAPAAAPKASHYLISPDRKQRIPADEKGNPLGPPEANPNG